MGVKRPTFKLGGSSRVLVPEVLCPAVLVLPLHHADKNMVTERDNATLLNVNTCTNIRTRYRVPDADLRLPDRRKDLHKDLHLSCCDGF